MQESRMSRQHRHRLWLLAFAAAVLPAMAQDAQREGSANLLDAVSSAVREAVGARTTQPAAPQRPGTGLKIASPDAPREDKETTEPPDIHVSPQGRVEMHVRELDLATVLQMLSIQSQRNIIATKNVTGTVTANLYNVTFEEALTAVLDGSGATWREQGNFIYVYTKDEFKELEASARQKQTRIFRLHYVKAADIQAMVQPLLSTDGKITMTPASEDGIATSDTAAGGNSLAGDDCLLVVEYADRMEAIARAIAELDSRPRQVLVEATLLRAQLNEDNALGIDFTVVGGVDFQNINSRSIPADTNLTTGALPTNRLDNTTWTGNTDFRDAVPDGGFTFGIIKDSVAAFVRSLEQVTDTVVLANPKILTLNKQHGEVIVGRRDGYLTTTVTQTAAVQNVQFLETGTQLRFRPYIGNDGYIRMEIHPEDSTGGLTSSNLPYEQTTEVTTNILVRDGHTILIGGLFREVTTTARNQVPIVGNIPVAGALFRNTRDNTQREEVIILLTVHIVKEDDTMAEESRKAMEDIERYRVGMRKGVQCFGRERLAQAHYQWAVEHMNKGHTGWALWDLDLAINNNPKFLAAIKLREQLAGRREWDEDASASRSFVMQQIMREDGQIKPLFERPGPPFEFPALEGPNGFDDGPPRANEQSCVPAGPTTRPHAAKNGET